MIEINFILVFTLVLIIVCCCWIWELIAQINARRHEASDEEPVIVYPEIKIEKVEDAFRF